MKRPIITVYIGYDRREIIAYEVLKYSILKHASEPVNIQPLAIEKLEAQGLMTRPVDYRNGGMFDVLSDAPQSTEFASSRFLSPLLQQSGIAIFLDCDMVFTDDICDIWQYFDPRFAVQCVKHKHEPTELTKMDNQTQARYERKNWSSFFLLNADHEANKRLTIQNINRIPGRDLHRFCWLTDSEIGELPAGWNWLVNVQEKPEMLYNAHFTLGGPWFENWKPAKNDDLWLMYKADYESSK